VDAVLGVRRIVGRIKSDPRRNTFQVTSPLAGKVRDSVVGNNCGLRNWRDESDNVAQEQLAELLGKCQKCGPTVCF
jgi:hypothetical protein